MARKNANWLRRDPHRLFFPLGIAFGLVAVGQWILFSAHLLPAFRLIFHALVQIQGFLTAFACGFILTTLPRRTESPPAKTWLVIALAASLLISTELAWQQRWAHSQIFWLAAMAGILGFTIPRLWGRGAHRRAPTCFVWLVAAFAMGAVGALLTAALAFGDYWTLHNVGRGMVLQGMILALFVAIAGDTLPSITRGEPLADRTDTRRDRLVELAHVAAACFLALSFYIEAAMSFRAAIGMRAAVVLLAWSLVARPWRTPTRPGLTPRVLWFAAWCVPLGYLAIFVAPAHRSGFLHVSLIGGFALFALAGASQLLQRGNREPGGYPLGAIVTGLFVIGTLLLRLMMEFDPDRYIMWMGVGASVFCTALVVWIVDATPQLLLPRRQSRE